MSVLRSIIFAVLFVAFGNLASYSASAKDFMLGVDANYSLEMEENGLRWKWNDEERDLFAGMQQHGVRWLRVRVWTRDEGVQGKEYATRVIERSNKAGLTPYLVLFLSEEWADLNKQPVPAAWKNLSFDERLVAVRRYCRETVRHFRQNGLTSHLYEIGNEIDYGICGAYPGKHAKKDPTALSSNVWPAAAKIILAAEDGVREADPDAQFLLHIAHWWDADFGIAFFKFMLDQGVRLDYAGLSYFPSSNIGGSLTFSQFGAVIDRVHEAINRPLIVAETAYPATAHFAGQFAGWKTEAPGYPLSPEGQRKWLGDFLKFCDGNPAVAGAFYWSPEWYGSNRSDQKGMWKGFALFDANGGARPAWESFSGSE
jgi:arabinogalactan endo-1,4-beta-galactosidase